MNHDPVHEQAIRQMIAQDVDLAYMKPEILAQRIAVQKFVSVSVKLIKEIQTEIKMEHQAR